MEPVIEVKGLKHIYTDSDNNRITALEQIDMQIMPGEFVAVIGSNGSGKSTLARHLNALLLPTEGSVKINGMDTMEEDNLWMIRQQIDGIPKPGQPDRSSHCGRRRSLRSGEYRRTCG